MGRNRKRKGDPIDGWLNLDKPYDITSTRCVSILKRLFNAQKVGHGGTLDPLATGILPIALGNATKTVAWAMDADKTYEFTVAWGVSTASYDVEGVEIARSDVRPTEAAIEEVLPEFVGEIEQVPPKFSAIKIDGKRAYDLARDGEEFEIAGREVTVFSAELVEVVDADHATFRVRSGKGFYVRAMARDLAQRLGTEGHISMLRRTQVGVFEEGVAVSLEELETLHEQGGREAIIKFLEPVDAPLDDIPEVQVSSMEAHQITQGQHIVLMPHVVEEWRANRSSNPEDDRLALAMLGDDAIALGEVRAGRFQPVRVLAV